MQLRILEIACLPDVAGREQFVDWRDFSASRVPWSADHFQFDGDWTTERSILTGARSQDGVLVSGMSLIELETLFRLRALQLDDGDGRLDVPAIILVRSVQTRIGLPRFGKRLGQAWPFRSAIFVGDDPTVAFLRAEGLTALSVEEAAQAGLRRLLTSGDGQLGGDLSRQTIGIQIVPHWSMSGSTTVFSNQLDALLDRDIFTIRIFFDAFTQMGPTLQRRLPIVLAEITMDTAPHIESCACPSLAPPPSKASHEGEVYFAASDTQLAGVMADPVLARLVRRARVAVVNYAINIPTALNICPDALIVLETHDYMTRHLVDRARLAGGKPAFPSFASIRKHVARERDLWRAADVCVSLSMSEFETMRRYNPNCVYVTPKPYARRSVDPKADAKWDVLVVASWHPINNESVNWFLQHVVAADRRFEKLRIAIVGRSNVDLERLWADKLPNVHWLGFVEDLDALRDETRLTVCPDLAGTGVSIKTLTALAAEHPIVATRVALRSFGPMIFDIIPTVDTADAMMEQIVALLDDDLLLDERRRRVAAASRTLWATAGHSSVIPADIGRDQNCKTYRRQPLPAFETDRSVMDPPLWAGDGDGVMTVRLDSAGLDCGVLGRGWHAAEASGSWTDGQIATLRIPSAWFAQRRGVEIGFMPVDHVVEPTLTHGGRSLPILSCGGDRIVFDVNADLSGIKDGLVELDLAVSSAFCPADLQFSEDQRVLGLHVRYVKIGPLTIWRPGLPARLGAFLLRLKSFVARRLAFRFSA